MTAGRAYHSRELAHGGANPRGVTALGSKLVLG